MKSKFVDVNQTGTLWTDTDKLCDRAHTLQIIHSPTVISPQSLHKLSPPSRTHAFRYAKVRVELRSPGKTHLDVKYLYTSFRWAGGTSYHSPGTLQESLAPNPVGQGRRSKDLRNEGLGPPRKYDHE